MWDDTVGLIKISSALLLYDGVIFQQENKINDEAGDAVSQPMLCAARTIVVRSTLVDLRPKQQTIGKKHHKYVSPPSILALRKKNWRSPARASRYR